jgi:23S rRNA pseudouridine1911/1915/1917 synthase
VGPARAGFRLDQAIAAELPQVSRTLAKKVLGEGGVFVDRKRVKIAGRLVQEGQTVEVNVAGELLQERPPLPELELFVVSESSTFFVVDKPSGMLSAPSPETDQHDVLAHLAKRSPSGVFLVHRLDRPTSGLMVVAKSAKSAAHLSEQVATHAMKRSYEALIFGSLEKQETVSSAIDEKEAITHFSPLQKYGDVSHVRADLETGRTHQVRIHATHRGTPILGDSKYGRALTRKVSPRAPRLALHARRLVFQDPENDQMVEFESEFPEDLRAYLKLLPPPGSDC